MFLGDGNDSLNISDTDVSTNVIANYNFIGTGDG
jgi:hypothetical protein